MNKKIAVTIGSSVIFAVVALATLAGAQTTSTNATSSTSTVASTTIVRTAIDKKSEVRIGVLGRTMVRGTVTGIGSSSLTIKSWGINWTINVTTSTGIHARLGGKKLLFSQIAINDVVTVNGLAKEASPLVITANQVTDLSVRIVNNVPQIKKEAQTIKKIEKVDDKIKKLEDRKQKLQNNR